MQPVLIVGAGAHSLVRKDTLTPFAGNAVPERFSLGDLELTGPDVPDHAEAELSLYLHRGGWAMLILHLPNGQFRVTLCTRKEGRRHAGTSDARRLQRRFRALRSAE